MARAKRDTDNEAAASDVDGTSTVAPSTSRAQAPPVTSSQKNPPLNDLLASAEANRKERASGAHQAAQRLLTKMFNKRVV